MSNSVLEQQSDNYIVKKDFRSKFLLITTDNKVHVKLFEKPFEAVELLLVSLVQVRLLSALF